MTRILIAINLLLAGALCSCGSSKKPDSSAVANTGGTNAGGTSVGGAADPGGGGAGTSGSAGAGGAGGAASCVDVMTDAENCGVCGFACDPTAECNGGLCGFAPTVLVPAATGCGSLHLALDGATLYFTDTLHGTVNSVDATGVVTPIATDQMAPTVLLVNRNILYWLNTGSNEIMTVSTSGGTPTAFVSIPPGVTDAGVPNDITNFTIARGSILFYATAKSIYKLSVTPGVALEEVGHDDLGIPKALAVDLHLLVFPTDQGDVEVIDIVDFDPAVCAKADSTTAMPNHCVRAAEAQTDLNLDSVAVIGDTIYYANGPQILSNSGTAPTATPNTIATASATATRVSGFTINNDTVYFADDAGVISKAPLLTNATATKLARTQADSSTSPTTGVSSLVASGTTLYWANPACEIVTQLLE